MKTELDTVHKAIAILKDRIPKALYALEVPSRNPYDAYPELKDAELALAALSTIEADACETGWMIEKSSGIPVWWRGLPKREGSDSWSTDSLQGIRFARKVDAEVCALAQGYKLSAVKATDHRWG